MMKSTAFALVIILLPGASLCSPASGEDKGVVITQGAAVAAKPATESVRGMVASIDQGNDTLEIGLSSDKTEWFKVQDGLLFNVVRYGDQVEIAVQNIAGAKTIEGLRKE